MANKYAPEPKSFRVKVMRRAVSDAHVQRHVFAVEHLCNRALNRFHQLRGYAHLSVAAEDCERSHMTRRIVGFVGPGERGG
jgi:hypothetical protein